MGDPKERIKSQHLRRNAYLYVRQSTLRQVMEQSDGKLIGATEHTERIVQIVHHREFALAGLQQGLHRLVGTIRYPKAA